MKGGQAGKGECIKRKGRGRIRKEEEEGSRGEDREMFREQLEDEGREGREEARKGRKGDRSS